MNLWRRGAIIVLTLSCIDVFSQGLPRANNGVLDARNWDFNHDKLPLDGYWLFFENQLLSKEQCYHRKGTYSYFPRLWNDIRPSNDGTGFGTYYLRILLPATAHDLSLDLPHFYSSYELFIAEKKIAWNGYVGNTKEKTLPQWNPQVVPVSYNDTLHIILQIANFHHFKGGAKDSISLGLSTQLNTDQRWALTSNHLLTGMLLLECLIFLFYFSRSQQKIALYFSLLCLSWAARSMFANLYTIINIFPDFNWEWLVRIEYLTLFLPTIYGVLFLSRLFNNINNQIIKYSLVTINCLFICLILFASPLFFTRWLSIYLMISGFTITYGIFIIIYALINEQIGAWFLVISLFLGSLIFIYDIFTYQGVFQYHPVVFNIGYILIFMFTTIALLMHEDIIKTTGPRSGNMLTYNDLYR